MQDKEIMAQAPQASASTRDYPELSRTQNRLLRSSIHTFPSDLIRLLEYVVNKQLRITLDFPFEPKKASSRRWQIVQMTRIVRNYINTASVHRGEITERHKELHHILSAIRCEVTYTGENGDPQQTSHLTIWSIHHFEPTDPIAKALQAIETESFAETNIWADPAQESNLPEQKQQRMTQEDIINKYFNK